MARMLGYNSASQREADLSADIGFLLLTRTQAWNLPLVVFKTRVGERQVSKCSGPKALTARVEFQDDT